MGFGLGDLNPTHWSIGGTPVLSGKGLGKLAVSLPELSVGVDPRNPDAFAKARDRYETGGVLAGNYLLPGSSLLTGRIASKGSQKQLNSPLGMVAQLGTGAAGLGFGSGMTGIPASPGGAWEASMAGGGGGGDTGSGLTPAQQASDPVLAGDGGQAWAPSAGPDVPSAPPLAEGGTTATSGATGAATGMSTAQKIALGLMGWNAFGGKKQKKQPLNPDLMAGATPAQNTSNSILDQFNKGQLNAADQYNIAKWAQDSKAKKQQYYAQAGLSDSSMATQDIASIDAQAGAMRDQALNNMLQVGLQAAGIANSATGNAVQLQMQQDQAQQQAQQQFFEMLAYSLA